MKHNGIEFSLSKNFLSKYENKQPAWGPLGFFVYKRTYARLLEDGNTEEFWQTLQRVVEGCFLIQKMHCKDQHIPWDNRKAQKSAQEMFERMWEFKFLPPGRGLANMGTDAVWKKGSAALQNCGFCSTRDIKTDFSGPFTWMMSMSMYGVGVGFDTLGAEADVLFKAPRISSEAHVIEDSREGWVDALRRLLDSYVGADTLPSSWDFSQIRPEGAFIHTFGGLAPGPKPLQELLENAQKHLDRYVASDRPVDSTLIVDLMNLAGAAVVAGGVRRTAQISLGSLKDEDYLQLKNQENINLPCTARWASNNSLSVTEGTDYSLFTEQSAQFGEPGVFWIENARKYGRMKDGKNNKDRRVLGVNPCQPAWATVLTPEGVRTFAEIDKGSMVRGPDGWTTVVKKWNTGIKPVYEYRTDHGVFVGTENHRIFQNGEKIEVKDAKCMDTLLGTFPIVETKFHGNHEVFDITVDNQSHSYWTGGVHVSNCGEQSLENLELCNLVESFPINHIDLEDYKRTLKFAYMYAKTVTLLKTHDQRTNAVMLRNRRIGLSQSGIVQQLQKVGFREHMRWCDEAYNEVRVWDDIYSEWLCVSRSIKMTSIKPSGTVSLLCGVTPGIHFPHSPFYIRRVRVAKQDDLWKRMEKAGYHVEPDKMQPDYTMIVEFPVAEEFFDRRKSDVSMWEQLEMAAQMQYWWSDNQVSVTVTVRPEEAKDLANALSMYEDRLKSVSFLPLDPSTFYEQAPYEEISEEEYKKRVKGLKRPNLKKITDKIEETGCDGDTCTI